MARLLSLVSAVLALSIASVQGDSTPPPATNKTSTSNYGLFLNIQVPCIIPENGLAEWYLYNYNQPVERCTKVSDTSAWGMIAAYRSGGQENVHWKYTNNPNDPDCMKSWTYYAADGTTVYAKINSRTTMEREKKRWCALPVYRTGGVQGKQWDYCYSCPL